jgi:tRNA(Arg) A34 adenosine deaminase TadA
MTHPAQFMREAIRLSRRAIARGEGGPFGAVVVHRGRIIGRGWNRVLGTNDPTAHAEMVAIREACRRRKGVHLDDCDLYTSCEPCPMCLSAIYWARLRGVFFANTRADAGRIGFQDQWLYRELRLSRPRRRLPLRQLLRPEALAVFEEWQANPDRLVY